MYSTVIVVEFVNVTQDPCSILLTYVQLEEMCEESCAICLPIGSYVIALGGFQHHLEIQN